ncbi:uncharacterized protein LOC134288485 [Aedes albopictus]|uniref:Integrase catalytic domain-containing protein n=1 Tax=Aedes albopictus TaxID=7160 RepID=A0ABM1YDW6_AEDAL
MRSSQRSEKRTEEWVKQAKVTESSGVVVVVQTPKPTSAIADHQGGASSGRPQVVHPSSTPLKSTAAVLPPVIGDNRVGVGFEVKSIPRTLGSITIGDESEESLEGAVGADEDERDELPLVNLQPYEDLLKVEEVMPVGANTGAIPKINRFGTHYKRWSVETGELRKQNALQLQRQSEAERRAIQDLQEKHRVDIDTRRRREVDLVNRITSLQLQHDAELKLVRESEANLRKLQDRERADLNSRIGTLEKQLIKEKERMRTSEVDLRNQLEQRERECEALRLQVAELESELQCIREMEQQLQSQIAASRQREHDAIRVRNEAEKQYWDLHEEVQQIINRSEDHSADGACSPPLPPPPASWFEPVNAPNTASVNHCDVNPPFLLPPPPPSLSTVNTLAAVPNIQPQLLSQAVVPAYVGALLGPSPQQLAARQVVTKELPIFSGDPIDWPLFISSYQHSTETCGYTNSENLLRLQRSLRGNAKESVSSFLLHPSTVPQILSTLQQLYGRPEQIVNNMIAKVRATPPPKPDRFETLVSFALVVQNLCGHLKARAVKEERTRPKERSFVNAHLSTDAPKENRREQAGKTVANSGRSGDTNSRKTCPVCNTDGHEIESCSSFKGLDLDGRWKAVKVNKLCSRCLTSHARWPCKGEVCGINDCPKRHHRLLHFEPPAAAKTTSAVVTVHSQLSSTTLFRILPVTLFGRKGQVDTYAFLDDGSSVTLVERSIADALGVSGELETLHIEWTGGINKTIDGSERVTLEISESGGSKRYKLSEVYTVKNLGLPQQTTDYEELSSRFAHLGKLPVKSFKRAVPGILIGQSNSHLLATLKLREGKINDPIATKTRIGWAVCGSLRKPQVGTMHRQLSMFAEPTTEDLHEYVRRFFDIESLGVAVVPAVKGAEEQRACEILEATTRRSNGEKYETGLLWKHDYVEFPNSRPMAERRFRLLEKRLARNPELYDAVRRQIADFKAKGYIHEASVEELEGFDLRRTWYLPIGVVVNEKKPGKVRIIWDAAAKVEGISLNSMLLTGPDLLTPLLSVMFPYRERQVAVSADIKEMFLQILIREQDRSALLFPYRDSPELPMSTMVSDVAIFGAACSPAHSQFVKNMNAAEQEAELPRGAAAVKKRHYVDDYVDSFDTAEEAFEVAKEVIEVHRRAGFHIRNWMSSDNSVLEQLGEAKQKPAKSMLPDKETCFERVLGMAWMQEEDVFAFTLQFCDKVRYLLDDSIIPTKREMLRLVMSIYDPLGLVASFVIQGKIIIQEVWRTDTDWDIKIPQEIATRWVEWISMLKKIDSLRIPRCYFPGYDPESFKTLELHVFVDASAQAFAAVAYFRIVDQGQVRVALVSSKTKVAPLRELSIPRLELMAALLGARLRKTIKENHSLEIRKTYFWSDSTTVCSWIKSDTRRYRQFVAFRIDEILNLSRIDEWRWISTKANVADEATKWGKGPSCNVNSRWFQGPDFLYRSADHWSMVPEEGTDESDKELREAYVCSHLLRQPIVNTSRFSRYERLLRSMAYVHHFVDRLRDRKSSKPKYSVGLTSVEMQKAERTLWSVAQSEEFPNEVATLKQNLERSSEDQKQLEASSRLAKQSPFADKFGVLRVGSRAAEAHVLAYDAKFPIILPREHRITELLLDYFHRQFGHANDETVVNEVRQKFHVPRLRVEVRLARKRCMWCRVNKITPVAPKMGPLPAVRMQPFVRPFTYVGIDLFGPYLVKVGRSVAKRWVCLFTCLTVRAIHLEVVASLSTDSCKKAIRRFIARRGSPLEIYSDNGTNFVGANRELQEEISQIHTELGSTFTNAKTQWKFNPPAAPHMGGCWERMVRAVKSALGSVPVVRKLDDESFTTVLAEAESMVNSRPLTFIPLETADHESLTPNHFLLLSSSGMREPEKMPTDAGMALKNSWNMVKHTLDNFWRRWVKEYLPTIIRRTKWFQDVQPIKVGDLVLVTDENVRNRWLRGRVVRTIPGKDGVPRQAEVRTSGGVLKRPTSKLAVLDVAGSGDAEPEVEATRGGGCSPTQPTVVNAPIERQCEPLPAAVGSDGSDEASNGMTGKI